jgi:hypothetical protein
VRDGELARSIGLHGIYRLSRSSADDLDGLIEAPPNGAARIPRAKDRHGTTAVEQMLF